MKVIEAIILQRYNPIIQVLVEGDTCPGNVNVCNVGSSIWVTPGVDLSTLVKFVYDYEKNIERTKVGMAIGNMLKSKSKIPPSPKLIQTTTNDCMDALEHLIKCKLTDLVDKEKKDRSSLKDMLKNWVSKFDLNLTDVKINSLLDAAGAKYEVAG